MKIKTCLISSITPLNIENEINRLGYNTVKLPPSKNLTTQLKYHPDIITVKIGDKFLFETGYNPPHIVNDYVNLDIMLGDKYPNDCIFNLFEYNNVLFHHSDKIAEIYSKQFTETIKIKQGYVKCSTMILGNDSFITSDPSIEKVLKSKKYNVLKVENNNIELNGFSNGFIGGASINLGNIIAFIGTLKEHKDIKPFCNNIGIDAIELSNTPLYDYGGGHIV